MLHLNIHALFFCHKDKRDYETLNQANQKERDDPNNKIRDQKGEITKDTNKIKKIISIQLKNLYSTKLGKSKIN